MTIISLKTVTREKTSTTLQSQYLDLVTILIVTDVVIGRFSGEDLKCLAYVTVRLQPTVQLHCPITTLQINNSKIQQIMHQLRLRKL